jgi:chromosome segregation ATPase
MEIGTSLASLVAVIFLAGRWSQKIEDVKKDVKKDLDGFGARLGKLELGEEHNEGRVEALERQMARTQGQYEALIELIGGAKESVNALRQGNSSIGDRLEKKMDDLKQEQNDMKLALSERLKAVETTLQMRGNRQ